VPVAPESIVIHGALLAAVHAHPAPDVTFTVPLVAVSGAETLDGEIVVEHDALCWVTETVWPAMVRVPVREPLPVLAANESETTPLPVPAAPAVTVIHGSALTAVHAQPAPEVTETVPVDAPDGTERLVDDNVNVQPGAACVTVNVRPPTTIAAERTAAVVLAATL
jgi:hypothetical protein